MVKSCSHGFCRSDARNTKSHGDMQDVHVFFVPFPKPKNDVDKCLRWILACGREDITLDKVKRDTFVCSKHFVGGNGPTETFPDPLPLSEDDFAVELGSERKSKKHVCRPLELANKLFGQYGEQVLMGKMSCSSLGLLQQGDEDFPQDQSQDMSHQDAHQSTSDLTSQQQAEFEQQDQVYDPHITIKMEPTSDGEGGSELPSPQDSYISNETTSTVNNAANSNDPQVDIGSPSRTLSQKPNAVRQRRCREKLKNNQDKYAKVKEMDRERAKEYRKNMTEEQRQRSRMESRVRKRQQRLRKKLMAEGGVGSEAGMAPMQGIPSTQSSPNVAMDSALYLPGSAPPNQPPPYSQHNEPTNSSLLQGILTFDQSKASTPTPSPPLQNITPPPNPYTERTTTQTSSSLSSTVPNVQNLLVKMSFGSKELSPSPVAQRMRRWRQKMMQDQQKYMRVKENDRKRSKKYLQNLSEEQKAAQREKARERTRRCRLRKKLLAMGVTDDELKEKAKQAVPSTFMTSQPVPSRTSSSSSIPQSQPQSMVIMQSQLSTPAMTTTTPYQQTVMQYQPLTISAGSQASVSFQQSALATSEIAQGIDHVQPALIGNVQHGMMGNDQQGMVGNEQQGTIGNEQQGMMGYGQQGMMGNEQQGMMGNEMAKSEWISSTGVDTKVSTDEPTDVFMWSGPNMVNKETNTVSQHRPRTSEKGCQIQPIPVTRVADSSSQTDLTHTDLAAFDSQDKGADVGIARRKFIVNDVMRDDQTCSFYTGFSLVMIAWLFDLLKGGLPTSKDSRKAKEGKEPSCGLNLLEQFLLVLVWLRQGLHTEFIAHLFGVTCDTVHRVSESWLGAMCNQLHLLAMAKNKDLRTSVDREQSEPSATDRESHIPSDQSGKVSSKKRKRCDTSDMPNFTHHLIFQRTGDYNFTLSNRTCVTSSTAMSFKTCSPTKLVTYNSSKPLVSSLSVGKRRSRLSKNSGKLKRGVEDVQSTSCFKRRKLCKRTQRRDKYGHVVRRNVQKELDKFRVLQTIYPYSQKVLIHDALKACTSLANFIVNDMCAS